MAMNINIKRVVSLVVAVLLAISCTACSQGTAGGATDRPASTAAEEPVTITFYTYNYSSTQKSGVDKLIADFEAENDDIRVEIVFAQDINSKIQADIAAGVTPDLIQVIFNGLDFAVNNFGVQDLNEIVDADELAAHLAGFEPAVLEVAKMNGSLKGLPYTLSTPINMYNATLFEEAGLDPARPPKTWAEVEASAVQINERTQKDGFIFGDLSSYDWLLQGVLKSNGADVMSEDRRTITLADPKAVEAVTVIQNMHKKGALLAVDNATAAMEAFSTGEVGMLLTTSAVLTPIIAAAKAGGWDLRTAAMPSFGNKPAVPTNSGSGLFICSTDPAKQQAAWKFLKYVTSDAGYTVITTMMGYPPLRPNVMEDERYLKTWAQENPLYGPNLAQLKIISQWRPYPGNNYTQIGQVVCDAAKKCFFNDVDVAQTLQDAQSQAQSLMPN